MINNSMSLSNIKALFRKSCVFWKCYHGFLVLHFRFDLCFDRDPYATTEIVQLMSKPGTIRTGNSGSARGDDSDSAAPPDVIMPEGITWNEWLRILREKYEENMQEQKQNQQESMEPTPKKTRKTPTLTKENTLGTMRSQTANRDTTIEEEEENTDDIDHNEHSQRF